MSNIRFTPQDNDKRKSQEEAYRKLNQDYKDIFKTASGLRVLKDIMDKGFFFKSTFTGNSKSFQNDGKRDLMLYILKRATTADPNILHGVLDDNINMLLERESK